MSNGEFGQDTPPDVSYGQPGPSLDATNPQAHPLAAKLSSLLQSMSGPIGKIGSALTNRPQAQQASPGIVGQAPQMSQPPGLGGGGLPLPPTATPPHPGYQPSPTSGQFMSQLSPQAAGVYQGIQGVSQFLQDWRSRKDQKDAAEASNVAGNFVKALDAAQNSPDANTRANAMQTLDLILKNKEYTKVLDKVYKGWLTQAESSKKKQKEPDPETQAFEQTLAKYFQDKAAGAAGAQPPQLPAQLQGYRLPMAGPTEQMQNIAARTQAEQMQRDPRYALKTQLTPEEILATERGAGPEKVEAEKAKARAEAAKAQSDVLVAGSKVREEEAKLQTEQIRAQAAKAAGEKAIKIKDIDYQRALVNLDRDRARLALAQIPKQTGQPPPTLLNQTNSAQQALDFVDEILGTRAKKGFTAEDVTKLTGMLQKAGASGLAKDLPKWLGRHLPDWIGGSGEDDVRSMRDAIQYHLNTYSQTIQERFPNWEGAGSIKSQGGVAPSAGQFDTDKGGPPEETAAPEGAIGIKTGPDNKQHYVDKNDNDLGLVGPEGEGEPE